MKILLDVPPALSLYSGLGFYIFVGQAGQWLIANYKTKVSSIAARFIDFLGIDYSLSAADKNSLAAAALFLPLLISSIVTAIRRGKLLVADPDADGFNILGAFLLAPLFMILLAGPTFSGLLPFKEDAQTGIGNTAFGIAVIAMMILTPLFFQIADIFRTPTMESHARSKWVSLALGVLVFVSVGFSAPPITGIALIVCVFAIWTGVLVAPRTIVRIGTLVGAGFAVGWMLEFLAWL